MKYTRVLLKDSTYFDLPHEAFGFVVEIIQEKKVGVFIDYFGANLCLDGSEISSAFQSDKHSRSLHTAFMIALREECKEQGGDYDEGTI